MSLPTRKDVIDKGKERPTNWVSIHPVFRMNVAQLEVINQ